MIITIGGVAGSGTTTVAKVLSERLGIPFVSAGAIFREMAAEMGMTPIEFGKFAESNTDIDKEIDNRHTTVALHLNARRIIITKSNFTEK